MPSAKMCSAMRLDRREAGAAGEQDDRPRIVLAQEERAHRPFDAQDVALLDGLRPDAEQVVREDAAGHVADVELQLLVGMRRRGDRVLAARAVAQDEVEVLAREVLQPLGRRQLQRDDRHVGCHALDARDARRHSS